jgi:hypothetical protein
MIASYKIPTSALQLVAVPLLNNTSIIVDPRVSNT